MSSPSVQAVLAPTELSPESKSGQLAAIRSELDRVDDALHDALMRRAELVAQVGALRAKGPVPLRPGREAAIIRRLLARNHGALNTAMIVRMWREMISGFTAQLQQEMRVVIDDKALLEATAAHFGLLTPMEAVAGAPAAFGEVMSGAAAVAVVRWPGDWWMALLDGRAATLHVVARLPFWGEAAGGEAMVLTQAPPDPSGDDRTLIGTRGAAGAMLDALRRIGPARIIGGDAGGPCLIEVDDFIAADDARLADVPGRFSVLGAYATKIGDER